MRTITLRSESDTVTPSLLLLGFGAVLLVAAFFYPGREAAAATTFSIAGAVMVGVGVLLPRMRELEIGPAGVKTKLVAEQPPQIFLDKQADKLTRFAHLISGDPVHAKELAEDAIARSGQKQRRLPASERDMFAIRTLIALLDTVQDRRWLLGAEGVRPSRTDGNPLTESNAVVALALQRLPFSQRVAFVLRADLVLRIDEIAMVLQRSVEDVSIDISNAREALRPYIESRAQAADGR
jgi:DNA-directed RNA polymerase specialized sigma24 family protein